MVRKQNSRGILQYPVLLIFFRADLVPLFLQKKVIEVLCGIREKFLTARRLLKHMGQSAGVEIEPDEQSALADATMNIEGVLAAGVPGAGGQDALFAIVLSSCSRHSVEQLWSTWGSGSLLVCPLILTAATKDRSGVQPEFEMLW